MKVSFNEITVICKKAFEGLGFDDGTYEDIAYMVAWSELYGFNGLAELKQALLKLEEEQFKNLDTLYQDEFIVVADNNNQSILIHGPAICDAIDARSQRRGLSTLRLLNCRNRKLILAYLSKCAMRNNNISVSWQANTKLGVLAIFHANQPLPEVHYYDTDEVHMNFPRACSMNIIFSQQVNFDFPKDETIYAKLNLITHHENLNQCMQSAFDNGIEVDEDTWAILKKQAAKILVESNEISRKGAG